MAKRGVGAFVRAQIKSGVAKFETAEKAVKKSFPESAFNRLHWNWYRHKAKAVGKDRKLRGDRDL